MTLPAKITLKHTNVLSCMTKCFSGLTIFYVMLRNDSYPRNKINPLRFGIWRFHFDRNVLWFWQNTFCCKITNGKIWGWANKGVGEVALLRGASLQWEETLSYPFWFSEILQWTSWCLKFPMGQFPQGIIFS